MSTKKDEKHLLSVAMIVKDEEANLPRCLDSIKDFVDEIVIVDTGSQDKTVEIAKKYTDKIYFYQWNNDFSAARNYSLKFPTGKWVLIIDADEEASEEMKNKLRSYLESLPNDVNTVYLPTISYLDWNFENKEVASTARVFKNGTVKYENIVHNQAIYKPKVEYAQFPIIHYGYIWTRKLKKKKYERTGNLIREHLKHAKDDAEKVYYLVQLFKTETVSGHMWTHVRVGWEIANLLTKTKTIPTIAFEFLYIFGTELLQNDIKSGADLLQSAIDIIPGYPDPYYGFMVYYFNKSEYAKAYEYSKKYFSAMENALSEVEKFTWTLNTIKEMKKAHGIFLTSALEVDDEENVKKHLPEIDSITDDRLLSAFCNSMIKILSKKDKEFWEKYSFVITKILEIMVKRGLVFDIRSLFQKALKISFQFNNEQKSYISQVPVSTSFEYWLKERLINPQVDYIYSYFLTNISESDFIDKHGIAGLVFIYVIRKDYMKPEELLKWLNTLRKKTNNNVYIGLINSFIADTYLKLGNVRSAIDYYKKAYETNKLLASFIKPILEDLKTSINDTDIEGVSDELIKYYMVNKDFLINLDDYPKEDLQFLYLISNHDFGKYISALYEEDPQERIELLEKVSKPNLFKNYSYLMAKAYEKIDIEKAYAWHIKAIQENEKLADIKYKLFDYTELYPAYFPSFYRLNDKKIWVGNISEKFSCQNIIQPVRAWLSSNDGFFYAIPYPTNDAVSIFLEREKNMFKKNLMIAPNSLVQRIISKLDWHEAKIIHDIDDDNFDFSVFRRCGIQKSKKSENVIILSGVERSHDLSTLITPCKKFVLFCALPDLENREDEVWFYPGFTILRPLRVLRNEIIKLGFDILSVEYEGQFVGIYGEVKKKSK